MLEEPLSPSPTPQEGAALLQWDSSLISAAPGNGRISCKPVSLALGQLFTAGWWTWEAHWGEGAGECKRKAH